MAHMLHRDPAMCVVAPALHGLLDSGAFHMHVWRGRAAAGFSHQVDWRQAGFSA